MRSCIDYFLIEKKKPIPDNQRFRILYSLRKWSESFFNLLKIITMKNISYQYINATTPIDQQYIETFIKLYRDAYGNDPIWREGMKDPKTGKNYSFQEYEQLKTSQNVSDFLLYYPDEEVCAMFTAFAQKQNRLDIAIQNARKSDELYAIISGYDDTLEQLNTEKLNLDTRWLWSVAEKLKRETSARVNYLAELFVQTEQQGYGYGKALLDKYIERQTGPIITRTTQLKTNPSQMFEKRGFKKIYDYPESDQRKRGLRLLET